MIITYVLWQVWEFLCRFSDILELKSPLTYEELETGLVKLGPPAAEDSPCKPAVEGTGASLEIANGLEQNTFVSVEAEGLPESTTVQEIRDLTAGPLELPVEEESAQERAVAFSDGTLNDNFVMMARTHITLLKLLLPDLQFRITGTPVVSKPEEPKKKGPKPQGATAEYLSDFPMNEVTWPELVRRYLITLTEAEKYGDLAELSNNERKWLLRCLQGDGGIPCGALYTVVGVESDAQVRKKCHFHRFCVISLQCHKYFQLGATALQLACLASFFEFSGSDSLHYLRVDIF